MHVKVIMYWIVLQWFLVTFHIACSQLSYKNEDAFPGAYPSPPDWMREQNISQFLDESHNDGSLILASRAGNQPPETRSPDAAFWNSVRNSTLHIGHTNRTWRRLDSHNQHAVARDTERESYDAHGIHWKSYVRTVLMELNKVASAIEDEGDHLHEAWRTHITNKLLNLLDWTSVEKEAEPPEEVIRRLMTTVSDSNRRRRVLPNGLTTKYRREFPEGRRTAYHGGWRRPAHNVKEQDLIVPNNARYTQFPQVHDNVLRNGDVWLEAPETESEHPPPARYPENPEDRQESYDRAKLLKYQVFTAFNGSTTMFYKPFTRPTTTTHRHNLKQLLDVINAQSRRLMQRQQRNESRFRGYDTLIPDIGSEYRWHGSGNSTCIHCFGVGLVPTVTAADSSQLLTREKPLDLAGAGTNRRDVPLRNDVFQNVLEGSSTKDANGVYVLVRGVLVSPPSPLRLLKEEDLAQQLQLQGERLTTKIQIGGTAALRGPAARHDNVPLPPPHRVKQRRYRMVFVLVFVALAVGTGSAVYLSKFLAKYRREYEIIQRAQFL